MSAEEAPLSWFGVDGRVAVVTGAASGIGRETALVLARAGATVVAADVQEDALAETAAMGGDRVTAVPTDVSSKASVDDLAARTVADHGRIDVWANIAGVLRPGRVVDLTEADLDLVHGVNFRGVVWGVAAAGRVMQDQGRGSIVNVASAGADMPAPGLAAYATSKAAVLMLTRTAAVELGPAGVRVNAVAPGFVDTPMVTYHFVRPDGSFDEAAKEAIFATRAAQSPLGINGEPLDIALAILYLASDAARFVTGQVLRPNGGVVMP